MNVIVNGLSISYDRAGNGPAVLCVHGWGDNLRTYDFIAKSLSSEYEVIRIDLPGFGASQMPEYPWNFSAYAEFLNKFLIKIGIPQLRACIGHSNGGALLIHALAQNHIAADKLVLLASAGVRNKNTVKRVGIKMVAKSGKVLTRPLPRQQRLKLQRVFYGTTGSEMLDIPHLQETFKLTVKQDVQEDAKKIAVPTLLIYGTKDKATPVTDGQKLKAAIKGSRLEVIESGHFVHLDEPLRVTTSITEFIA